MTLSQQLSQFITHLSFSDIPPQIVERAKYHLLDTLGVALAGSLQQSATQCRQGITCLPDHQGTIPIWGSNQTVSTTAAALANGISAHALDFDDTHTDSITHGSAVLTPIAFALGEHLQATTKDILIAWIIGWEVAARVGLASHSGFHQRGFHSTAIAGIFGATACASSLLKLTQEQTVHAIGLTGSQTSGVAEYLTNSSSAKCFHAGWAAQSGIIAACLAKGGMTGPETIFEGRYSLYQTHGIRENASPEQVAQDLGSVWEFMNVSIKPYPVCHFAHATVDCGRRLLRQGITLEQIAKVECVIDPVAAALICEPPEQKWAPQSAYAAKFSLPWLFAAGFIEDKLTLSLLSPENLQRTDIQNLAKKVSYRYPTKNEIPFPTYFPGLIFVTLTNGKTLTERLDIQYGNPKNPMSLEDIERKFYDNAGLIMGDAQATQLAKNVLSFETKNIKDITQLLRVAL
ncbi:MmgE/PrpD family protein [Providencia rettgeri]|uniref:MmgE/PrpD family protein n=1 Tax=Providencia rettgeri TaxID=587 RepID=UPI0034E0C901